MTHTETLTEARLQEQYDIAQAIYAGSRGKARQIAHRALSEANQALLRWRMRNG